MKNFIVIPLVKELIKSLDLFFLTLFNDLSPARFSNWVEDNGKFEPHKCSTKGCKHWAKFSWWEETNVVFKGKKYSEQKYGCYYHKGPYKNLP